MFRFVQLIAWRIKLFFLQFHSFPVRFFLKFTTTTLHWLTFIPIFFFFCSLSCLWSSQQYIEYTAMPLSVIEKEYVRSQTTTCFKCLAIKSGNYSFSLYFLYLYEVAALNTAAAAAASVATLFLMLQSLKPERNSSAITTFFTLSILSVRRALHGKISQLQGS